MSTISVLPNKKITTETSDSIVADEKKFCQFFNLRWCYVWRNTADLVLWFAVQFGMKVVPFDLYRKVSKRWRIQQNS